MHSVYIPVPALPSPPLGFEVARVAVAPALLGRVNPVLPVLPVPPVPPAVCALFAGSIPPVGMLFCDKRTEEQFIGWAQETVVRRCASAVPAVI